jgi:hypothetical protein
VFSDFFVRFGFGFGIGMGTGTGTGTEQILNGNQFQSELCGQLNGLFIWIRNTHIF